MEGHKDETQANRDRILGAAAHVFADKGYHSATMDDVVKSSGLSKGTVYWHFESKEGLLSAVMRRLVSGELRSFDRMNSEGISAAMELRAYVSHVAQRLEGLGPLRQLSLEFYSLALRRDWARAILREYYAQFRKMVCVTIQRGIDRGELRDVSAQDTAIALSALVEGMILLWVIDGNVVQIGAHSATALDLLLDGLVRKR